MVLAYKALHKVILGRGSVDCSMDDGSIESSNMKNEQRRDLFIFERFHDDLTLLLVMAQVEFKNGNGPLCDSICDRILHQDKANIRAY